MWRSERKLSKRARRWRWAAGVFAFLILLLAMDYRAYPYGATSGGKSGNRGENGLWLRYTWYFGQKSDEEVRQLAQQLKDRQVRYAYFHVRAISRSGKLNYHYPKEAKRLVEMLHRHAPEVKVLAWIYAGNSRGQGAVDLANTGVRKAMVGETLWLVGECGFDGVQWDYEICQGGDKDFLTLMRETRAALPPEKLLSTATPLWLPRSYVWLVAQQAVHVPQAVARGNPRCRVLLGVPTYGKGFLSHNPRAENIALALRGVRAGVADSRMNRSVFAGVAPFADYTTEPAEWEIYRRVWLEK